MLYLQLISLAVVVASIAVIAANMRTLRPMEAYPQPEHLPRASVLVPARDEERGVEACVRSLLAQDYPDFEVVVLDDGSTDETPNILGRLAAEDPRLRVIAGAPLPDGWLGKPWACAQLAETAEGDVLLFTDADTSHGPGSLRTGVSAAMAEGADLFTALTHIEARSWGEALVLPAIPWSTVTLLPLAVAYRRRWPWLTAANGQYLLFRRTAYDAVGGHAAVRDEVVEDMALGQRVKAAGLQWRMGDGSDVVSTRMYRSLREVYAGLGKNVFGVFGYGVLRYVVSWPVLVLAYLLPTTVLAASALGSPLAGANVALAAVTWALTAGQFAAGYRRFDYPPMLALLYPLTFLLIATIALWSLVLALTGRASWKGRRIERMPLRWV